MRTYVPITDAERKQMLETIGVSSMEELLCDVPESVRLKGPLQLPARAERSGRAAGHASLCGRKTRRNGRYSVAAGRIITSFPRF